MLAGSKFTPTFGRWSFCKSWTSTGAVSCPVSNPSAIFAALNTSAVSPSRSSILARFGSFSSCGRNPDALAYALDQFQGTLIFISHDVYFIRALANHVVHVNAGRLTHYPGGYQYYLGSEEHTSELQSLTH